MRITGKSYYGRRDTRLKGRVDSLLRQLLEVDVILEEGMPLDLLRSVYAEPLRRIASEETSEDAACFRRDFWPKDEWVIEDLAIHVIGDLYGEILVKDDVGSRAH